MTNKKVAEYLVKLETKKWVKENKQLFEDMKELVGQVMIFRLKWGIPVDLTITKEIADEIDKSI